MQEGPSEEEDLPEVQWLKGRRPTLTQPASVQKTGSHAEVDDTSEQAASSSKRSDTTQYRWVYLYTASLPSLQTDLLEL